MYILCNLYSYLEGLVFDFYTDSGLVCNIFNIEIKLLRVKLIDTCMRVLPIFELLNKLGLPQVQVKYISSRLYYNFFLQKLFIEEL